MYDSLEKHLQGPNNRVCAAAPTFQRYVQIPDRLRTSLDGVQARKRAT